MSTDSRRASRVVWNRSDAKCIVHNIIIMCVLFTVDVPVNSVIVLILD